MVFFFLGNGLLGKVSWMSLDEFGWSVGLGNSFEGSKRRLMDLMVFFLNNERLVGVDFSS